MKIENVYMLKKAQIKMILQKLSGYVMDSFKPSQKSQPHDFGQAP